MQLLRVMSCLAVVVSLSACPASPPGDAGSDSGVEDAGVDAGVDAGEPDAGEADAGEPDAGPPPVEICGDWLDNDADGGADCADLACAAEPLCLEDAGACATCGQTCAAQTPCLGGNSNYHDVHPLPLCVYSVCVQRGERVRGRVVVGAGSGWTGLGSYPKSGVSRFIKKTALDGSAVTCATLEAFTAENSAADAIEASGRFNVQGFDIQGVSGFMGPGAVNFMNVNTQTGGEFLVWVELWSGQVSGTFLPLGSRRGHGCLEDPGAPVAVSDDCDNGGGCRAFNVNIPSPD